MARARAGSRCGARKRRVAPTRAEVFADATNIASVSGLTYGVNRPAKYTSNPVLASSPAHQGDHHQVYATAIPDGAGGVTLFNTVFTDDWTRARVARYDSSDGRAFTRPNLGLFTVDGNTNNSVVLDTTSSKVFGHASYEPSVSATPYLIVGPDAEAYPYYPTIWGAASKNGPFSVLKRLDSPQTNKEPWSLVRRSDGRWLVHYQSFPGGVRSVGAYLSDTASLTGSWTDQGTIMTCTDPLVQFYSFAAWRDGDALFAMMNIFNGANQVSASAAGLDDRQYKMRLYTSRASDGLTWTLLDDHWIQAGNTVGSDVLADDGAPDWGCLKIGGAPVHVGNEARLYMSMSKERHHPYPNSTAGFVYQHTIGYAYLPRGRTAQVAGTGYVILRPVRGTKSGRLTINSVGVANVELLSPTTGAVLAGFSQADCDAIPADTFGAVVSWGGRVATPASFTPKIYLTGASAHRFESGPLT